ncbi:ABC transporter substrate-binding protein [Methanothrix sp.]|uniref:ABC transporter substrate-binding protein n=1 Tax=Methanothrix sp. TaxID=90426 RepID=UPI0023552700|nr:ABC transporter substrate-binding protein [Methanothrix sp.]
MALCLIASMLMASAWAAEYPLTITDSAGREVTFNQPIERVIVTSSDAAEAVVMLGAADKVVGISDTVKNKGYYFPDLKGKQSVGKWNALDYEMIGAIASEPFENIKAVALEFTKPQNMTREIEVLGQILGKEEQASDYISWYDEKINSVKDAVDGMNLPEAYVEWSSSGGDISTLGPGSAFDQVLKVAKGYNIASALEESYPKVDWEWVVTENPEIIIVRQTQPAGHTEIGWESAPSQEASKLQAAKNELLDRSGASGTSAAKSDRIYFIDWDIMNGLDQVVGATYLAKVLHPDVDLNPEEVYREYLERLGLEYPEGRTMVYPEIED